jgi:hypothetical protein
MVPLPQNLPLLVGVIGDQAEAIEKVLKGCPLDQALDALGKHWKVKVWFSQEVEVRTISRVFTEVVKDGSVYKTWKSYNKSTVHIFNFITIYHGMLLYQPTRKSRMGYHFPSLELVTKYEPVLPVQTKDEFESVAEFATRFDRRFITESEIQKLWAGTSAQHGGKYTPSDFHRLGPQGKRVLYNFLRLFMDVEDTEGKYYFERSGHKCLEQYHNTHSNGGRDIKISHTLGQGYVYYASEFKGCGNGSYGLIANENEFLHLEND